MTETRRKRSRDASDGDGLSPVVAAKLRSFAPTFLCMGAKARHNPAALAIVSSAEAQKQWEQLLQCAPVVYLSLPASLRRTQWAQAAAVDGTTAHLREWEHAAATSAYAFINAPPAARGDDSVVSNALGTVGSWVDAVKNSRTVASDFRKIPYNMRNDHTLCATALARDPALIGCLTFTYQRMPSLYEPCLAQDARLLRHVHDRAYGARRLCPELLQSAVRANSAVYFQLDPDEREGLAPTAAAGVPGLLGSTLLSQTPNAVGPHCLRILYDVSSRPGDDLLAWEAGWVKAGTADGGPFASLSCGANHILHKALRRYTHPEEESRPPKGVVYLARGCHETRDAHIERLDKHSKPLREAEALVHAILHESATDLKAAVDAFNALVTRRRDAGALLAQGDLPWLSPLSLAFGLQRLRCCASDQPGAEGRSALLETIDVLTLKDAADCAIRDLPDGKQAPSWDGEFEAHFVMQLTRQTQSPLTKECLVLLEEERQGGRGCTPSVRRTRFMPFSYMEGPEDRGDVDTIIQGTSAVRRARGSALLLAAEEVAASQRRVQQVLWVLGQCLPLIADYSYALQRFVDDIKRDDLIRTTPMVHFANVLDIVELAYGRQSAACRTDVGDEDSDGMSTPVDNLEITLWPICLRGAMRAPASAIFEPRPSIRPVTRSILSEYSLSLNGLCARAGKVIGIVRALHTSQRTLALAMCLHQRLGADSPLGNTLPDTLIAMIADMLWDKRTRDTLLFDADELKALPQKKDFGYVNNVLKTLTLYD